MTEASESQTPSEEGTSKTMHPTEYLPEGIQAWLREINWPEKRWHQLGYEAEILPDGMSEPGSDGSRWMRWKPGEHTTVKVCDSHGMVITRARFHCKDGVWTRVSAMFSISSTDLMDAERTHTE
jgi:hypothetical protein